MRFKNRGVGIVVSAVTLGAAVLAGPNAYASHGGGDGGSGGSGTNRPCGPEHKTDGKGSLGTAWTLKSKYDDDGAQPGVVVGEEFEIATQGVGRQWHVKLADNGVVFFDKVLTSDATGIKAMAQTPDQGGVDQVMSASATDLGNGETIFGTVTDPGPPPAACGH